MTELFQKLAPSKSRDKSSSESEDDDQQKEYDIRKARYETHRRKIGLKLTKKQLEESHLIRGNSEKQDDLIQYIQTNYSMKECIKYTPLSNKTGTNLTVGSKCHCGALPDQHWRKINSPRIGSRDTSPSRSDMLGGLGSPGKGGMILTPKVTKTLLAQQRKRKGSFSKKRGTTNTIYPNNTLQSVTVDRNATSPATPTPNNTATTTATGRNPTPTVATITVNPNTPSSSFPVVNTLPPIGNPQRDMGRGQMPGRLLFQEFAKECELKGSKIGSPKGSPRDKEKVITQDWATDAFCEIPTNAYGKVEFANDESRTKPAKTMFQMGPKPSSSQVHPSSTHGGFRPSSPPNSNPTYTVVTDSDGSLMFMKMFFLGSFQYIRLSDTTPVEKVLDLMVRMRMLYPHRPSLAISVIGGAKNFNLDGKKKEIFSHGLVKAAQATNAWILTSGCYMGVMKQVGEAVRDGQSLQLNHTRVSNSLRCIGIGAWGIVRNNSDLVNEEGKGLWPATYHVDPVVRHGQPVSLDPNHTHFILVDDGYRNMMRKGVAEFRAKLERHIAAPIVKEDGRNAGRGGLGIPVVVVLVEGGLDSVDFAHESLKCRIPLVLCQGTGRAADILSYAFKHHIRDRDENGDFGARYLPLSEKQILLDKLKHAYGKTMKVQAMKDKKRTVLSQCEERLDTISKCCQEEDLITVFDINRDEDLDLAILYALLKGRGASRIDQLKLALKWNRSDVAEEKLFVESAVWGWGELEGVMTEALANNRVDFVRLLLQHGVVMKDYLTVRRLRLLYNSVGRGSYLRTLLLNAARGGERFFLHHVKEVLERLVGRSMEDVYALDSEEADKLLDPFNEQLSASYDDPFSPIGEARFEKPFKELFLWAVLMHRHSLARFFWERGDSPVIGALVATKIYDALANIVAETNPDLTKTYRSQKAEFENLAISILECAYNADPEKALLIVEQRQQHWGKISSLEIAYHASDKRFLATPCAQNSVDQIWKRGLACSGAEIVLGLLCPLYVLFKIRFDRSVLGVDRKSLTYWQRLSTFYKAPITKFCSFTLCYIVFLMFYTYVILFDFSPTMSSAEIALHIWVFTLIVSAINDTRASYATVPREHRSWRHLPQLLYKTSIWYKVELIAVFMHVSGLSIRWLPEENFDVTRTVFSLCVVFFYLRLLRVYMASSYLGPKLFVIRQMFKDVVMFLMILFVFMMAYAVGSQALLFPNRKFTWGIFGDILYYPYWQMYGELSLDQTIGGRMEGCEGNVTMNEYGQWCPRRFWPAAILLASYLLIVNILLVNLLIAVFTHVFEEVQANSTEIWKFEMWSLAEEFDQKNTLPPPLTLVETIYTLGRQLLPCCGEKDADFNIPLSRKQRENLQIFEKECMNEYLRHLNEQTRNQLGNRVKLIQERVESLCKKSEDEQGKLTQLEAMHRTLSSRSLENPHHILSNTGTWPQAIDLAFEKYKSSLLTRKDASTQVEEATKDKSELEELQQRLAQLELKAQQNFSDIEDEAEL